MGTGSEPRRWGLARFGKNWIVLRSTAAVHADEWVEVQEVVGSGHDEQAEARIRSVALALGLAGGAGTETAAADAVSQEVWIGLHDEGLVRTERDPTDEYVTYTTQAGQEHLIAALADKSSVSGGE